MAYDFGPGSINTEYLNSDPKLTYNHRNCVAIDNLRSGLSNNLTIAISRDLVNTMSDKGLRTGRTLENQSEDNRAYSKQNHSSHTPASVKQRDDRAGSLTC